MPVNNAATLVPLPEGAISARFLRRVKRFSVEVERNGQTLWAHCNNSGSMLGLLREGCGAVISPAAGKNRKLAWTLERVRPHGQDFWVGVNTLSPNRLLKAAFLAGLLDFARGYASIRLEAPIGQSRLDAMLEGQGLPVLWVECKNVTLVEDGVAAFPDAASSRARKHLRELMEIVASGARAAMFYCIQRPDASCFAPAAYIDPEYAELFQRALESGVEAYPYVVEQNPAGLGLGRLLKIATDW